MNKTTTTTIEYDVDTFSVLVKNLLSKNGLHLPSHINLDDVEVKYVITTVYPPEQYCDRFDRGVQKVTKVIITYKEQI